MRDLAQNPDDAVIIRAIIQLGTTCASKVAEGTETIEQMDFLRREGAPPPRATCSAAPRPRPSRAAEAASPLNR